MKRFALLLALAVLLPGCASESSPEDPTEGTPDSPAPTEDLLPESTRGSAVVTGAGVEGASGGFGGAAATITAREGATLLYAEIQWADPVFDIDLALSSPAEDHSANPVMYDHTVSGGSPGSPDSPHSITIQAPAAGEWLGSAFANGVGVEVAYDVALTVFYGETTVPDGYTGF